jgi:hypothetical protein
MNNENAHRDFLTAKAEAEAAGVGAMDDHPLRHAVDSARERYWSDHQPAVGGKPKNDPYVYVDLAEQGLNNTEIADRLGDVSEAAVRRGLRKAGYVRA